MLELYLFRHGQTNSNIEMRFLGATDMPLNEVGISQAENARFKDTVFDAVYASPLKRTMQTAKILNENLGLEIQKLDSLKERNFGIFDNLTIDEMKKLNSTEYDAWQADYEHFRITDGESADDVLKRVKSGIDEILNLHKCALAGETDERVLVVSHLNAIRFMLSAIFGFSFEQSRIFNIKNASFVKIEITKDRRIIVIGEN